MRGKMFTTKTGEISIKCSAAVPLADACATFVILAKALRPPRKNGTDSKTPRSATASAISI